MKSDDVVGRVKTYEAIVKGENIPEPGIPESFKVLIKEMQSLGLDVRVLAADDQEIQIHDTDEDITETAKELGLDQHEALPAPTTRVVAKKDEEEPVDDEEPSDEEDVEPLIEEDIDSDDLK